MAVSCQNGRLWVPNSSDCRWVACATCNGLQWPHQHDCSPSEVNHGECGGEDGEDLNGDAWQSVVG